MPAAAHPVNASARTERHDDETRMPIVRWWLIGAGLIIIVSTLAELIWMIANTPWSAKLMTATIITVLQIAAIAAMFRFTRLGALASIALMTAAQLLPVQTSFSTLFGGILATGILAYEHIGLGIAAMATNLLTAVFSALIYPESAMNSGGALSFNVFCLFAFTAGLGLRQRELSEQRASRAKRMAHDMVVAQYLHDYTTNDVNDIIMLADLALAQPDELHLGTMRQIRDKALDALRQTRLVIDTLEGDRDRIEWMGKRDVGQIELSLLDLIDEQQDLLESYGFEGSVLIGEHLFAHCSDERAEMTLRLVRELFANIAQHAEPDTGYTFTIASTPQRLHIEVTDRRREGVTAGMNSGLSRFRKQILGMGGEWDLYEHDNEWMLSVAIPV